LDASSIRIPTRSRQPRGEWNGGARHRKKRVGKGGKHKSTTIPARIRDRIEERGKKEKKKPGKREKKARTFPKLEERPE